MQHHQIQPGQTADAIAKTLAAGDIVEFAAGTFAGNVTLNAKSNCKILSLAQKCPQISMAPKCSGIYASPYVSGLVVEGLDFNIVTTGNSAVEISGKSCQVTNITQSGAGRILTINSADNLTADLFASTSGHIADYGVWGADDGAKPARGPSNCKLLRFDIKMTQGEHGIRIHKHTNLIIGDPKLSYPGLNFAGRINYSSSYGGAALTLKEGTNAQIIRIQTVGPVGFGPNVAEIPAQFNPGNKLAGDPNWESLRLDGLHITGCEFNVGKRYFHLQAGCVKVLVENTKINADPAGACLQLDFPRKGPNGGWPAASGEFRNVKFTGARLIDPGSMPLLAHWKFTNCKFGARPLSTTGQVML